MGPLFKKSDSLLELIDESSLSSNLKGSIGLEKECLRVLDSYISQKSHMKSLGSSLCHKFITTDFAEAQLELVTPPMSKNTELLSFLENLQHYVTNNINNEYLWPFSIPARTRNDEGVDIAYYGKSNRAKFKEIYRNGLAERYGKTMQTISGIHFNYSFNKSFWDSFKLNIPGDRNYAFQSEVYFRALRNIQRNNWLLLYFFGASPILGKNLINDRYNFSIVNEDEYYLPFATSLRMSSMGYQNMNQSKLFISLNQLEDYLQDLKLATETPSKDYAKIKKFSDKEFAQLNSNLLQIEDEYYAISRPKSSKNADLRQVTKLAKYGIDYIELRSLDLNPFNRCGIESEDLVFIEVFVLYCTLTSSPKIRKKEMEDTTRNNHLVSIKGRKDGLKLTRNGNTISLRDWGNEILDEMESIAELFGFENFNRNKYSEQIKYPDTTLSGRVLSKVVDKKMSFYDLGDSIGNINRSIYKDISKSKNQDWHIFEDEKYKSIDKQEALEKKPEITLKSYIKNYYE